MTLFAETLITQILVDTGRWGEEMLSLTDEKIRYGQRLKKARAMQRDLADLILLHEKFAFDFPLEEYVHANHLEGLYSYTDDLVELLPMLRDGKKQEDLETRRRVREAEEARAAAAAEESASIASRVIAWRTPSGRATRRRVEEEVIDVDLLQSSLEEDGPRSLGDYHGIDYFSMLHLQQLIQV